MIKLEDKRAIVAEIAEVASNAYSAVIAEYRGMSVGDMTELRVKAREGGVFLKVVRNTLARRAVQGTEFECMVDALSGPVILAFSMEEPGAAGRIVKDFAKDNDKLVVTGVAMSGQLMPAEAIEKLAKMPTYDQSISMLMSVMKAPVEKFVRTLAEPHAKLVRTLAAVRTEKEQEAA
ncbi:50S ribosomal protein L10 [Candidatus Venteria ishoeyi]|uniref:Large ribosomal subunit protein uL10 n=1 Tax=Candidatus Venteria ishoeyi TaxID=1899563 RepID=A0A1H6FH51_9GAMM|nr:50S ribosomal protein L10 [Candidatus Venteria ishoeyi]SEH08365.1 50S ribosomal protein L10 [Candidatus Venteria ishoeyi]